MMHVGNFPINLKDYVPEPQSQLDRHGRIRIYRVDRVTDHDHVRIAVKQSDNESEISKLANLSGNVNVVALLDYEITPRSTRLGLELCHSDLRTLMDSGRQLSDREWFQISGKFVDSMMALHDRNILHGNVSPHHFLIYLSGGGFDINSCDISAINIKGKTNLKI